MIAASPCAPEGPFLALARGIDQPDAAIRATFAGSALLGIVIARYVVTMEPLASMTLREIAAAVGPAIEQYLIVGLDLADGEPIW